ncbi:DUF3307 domain-containing protein [Chloroflexi bacterium TSY]|nr:DUF3307 domain-containing protein [Chloroflexi bacterium TSY]
MFWPLLLSHLLADYPLQTDAMVQAKKTLTGLVMHVAIHLATMLVVIFGVLQVAPHPTFWGVLVITVVHFGIDTWKNYFSNRWPHWVILGYLQDQGLHIASIVGVTLWLAWLNHELPLADNGLWLVYACAFTLVTHAWFVTERVLFYKDKDYQQWVSAQLWPRLMSRAVLFSVVLLGWNLWGLTAVVVALGLHWFDLACPYRWRALLIDIGVVVSVMLGVLIMR